MRESSGLFIKPLRRNESEGSRPLGDADRGRIGRRGAFRPVRRRALPGRLWSPLWDEAHPERTRWDPKDGELCLVRTKSGETLMEVRSDSDVQIDRRNWV